MKKAATLFSCVCLALISLASKADTLKFNNDPNGVIGPYDLTLNGTTSLQLFCLDDFYTINTGETWTVGVVAGANLASDPLTMAQATLYEEAAYVLSQLSGGNNEAVQNALWKLFDTSRDISGVSGASTLYSNAVGSPGSTFITNGGYDGYSFYVYDGGPITGGTGTNPQNFIGIDPPSSVPEPSTLVLMGSGLTAMAGMARRRFARS